MAKERLELMFEWSFRYICCPAFSILLVILFKFEGIKVSLAVTWAEHRRDKDIIGRLSPRVHEFTVRLSCHWFFYLDSIRCDHAHVTHRAVRVKETRWAPQSLNPSYWAGQPLLCANERLRVEGLQYINTVDWLIYSSSRGHSEFHAWNFSIHGRHWM